MSNRSHPRLARLPERELLGVRVPVAADLRSRLFGLAFLARERAGFGLLIPNCCSVHTFGMRFPLDLVFIDHRGAVVARRSSVPRRRLVAVRGASGVLELPSDSVGAGDRGKGRGWRTENQRPRSLSTEGERRT